MTRKVTVTLVGIKNTNTGADPGNELEVYGGLFARRQFVNELGEFQTMEEQPLFQKSAGDSIDISEGSIFPITTQATLVIEPGQFLWLGGTLFDHDDIGSDDDLGTAEFRWPHDAIPSGPQTAFYMAAEGDQRVESKWSLIVS